MKCGASGEQIHHTCVMVGLEAAAEGTGTHEEVWYPLGMWGTLPGTLEELGHLEMLLSMAMGTQPLQKGLC